MYCVQLDTKNIAARIIPLKHRIELSFFIEYDLKSDQNSTPNLINNIYSIDLSK
jgi:hypothetical protein